MSLVDTGGDRQTQLRAAVVELAMAVALTGPLLDLASDHADPGYKADATERAELRNAIEQLQTWRRRHPELVKLAARVSRRRAPNPQALADAFAPELHPSPAAPHDPDRDARAEPGRW